MSELEGNEARILFLTVEFPIGAKDVFLLPSYIPLTYEKQENFAGKIICRDAQ